MTFAQRVIRFNKNLSPDWPAPEGIEVLYPFDEAATLRALTRFYRQYYDDHRGRVGIYGINPGRFGAGVTGVPFTDPIRLEEACGIDNPFPKKPELSSLFVYDFIQAYGSVADFYRKFFITSLCPLGFTKDGKNYNYYDSKALTIAVEPRIVDHLRQQLEWGVSPAIALCMGRGKNMEYFQRLNERYGFFEEIIPLPHPRWVMQYRRKRKAAFVAAYLEALTKAVERGE